MRRIPLLHDGPSIGALCEMVASSGVAELPAPGETYLVALVRRTHGLDPTHPDPWDDRIGILKRYPVGVVPEEPQREPMQGPLGRQVRFVPRRGQRQGTPEEGVLEWWSCVGTGEPGWNPMYRKGNIATHKDGCARYAAPQFARTSHGGGFHHYLPDRPAFRQVGPARFERFSEKTSEWRDVGMQVIAAHAHTISPAVDWRVAWENGVDDWSHACLVALRWRSHQELLRRGGWTSNIDGCRLSLLVLLWSGELE